MFPIVNYKAAFKMRAATGKIKVELKDRGWTRWIPFTNVEAFRATMDLLRNESKLFYNNGYILTDEVSTEEEFNGLMTDETDGDLD